MDKDLANKILSTTYTKSSLLRRARLIKDFITFRLFTKEEAGKPLREQIDSFFSTLKVGIKDEYIAPESEWLSSLGEEFFNSFTPDAYTTQVADLEKSLTTHHSLIIYLPFELPLKEQDEIGRWLKQNLAPEMMFETSFDADLIGGCAFSYKGIYKDYSIRANIKNNQAAILDSLKGFKNG